MYEASLKQCPGIPPLAVKVVGLFVDVVVVTLIPLCRFYYCWLVGCLCLSVCLPACLPVCLNLADSRCGTLPLSHTQQLNKKLILDNQMISRVKNEVEIHSHLRHPTILELFTYFEDNENVYLVMELCPNGELYRHLQRRGDTAALPVTSSMHQQQQQQPDQQSQRTTSTHPSLGRLSEGEARSVMSQLVESLQCLHRQGILHRDLKLSNLLLSKDWNIKLGDFGLAARLEDPRAEQKTMCGTPNYISPYVLSSKVVEL